MEHHTPIPNIHIKQATRKSALTRDKQIFGMCNSFLFFNQLKVRHAVPMLFQFCWLGPADTNSYNRAEIWWSPSSHEFCRIHQFPHFIEFPSCSATALSQIDRENIQPHDLVSSTV